MPRGLRRLCLYVGVVVAGAAPVARAANDGGQTCQERLGQMEAQLEKARQAKHGWILIWPQLEGFSVPVVASSRPLDWRGIVAPPGPGEGGGRESHRGYRSARGVRAASRKRGTGTGTMKAPPLRR